MRLRFFLVLSAAVVGCYTGSAVDANRPPVTEEPPSETLPVDAAPPRGTGIPCEVRTFVLRACGDCHGTTPANGAPNALVRYSDFARPSEGDPSVTVAALSLARMRSATRPMPPDGRLSESAIAAFARWVEAGLPRGAACPRSDAAAPEEPSEPEPVDAGPPETPSVCTSGTTGTTSPSARMRPGQACLECHRRVGGPEFSLAGTVYPTRHEPNGCNGLADARVVIFGADGKTFTLSTNAAGNFFFPDEVARPYKALVARGNLVREMKTLQTSGDCNGCHTERGGAAPGRIVAP